MDPREELNGMLTRHYRASSIAKSYKALADDLRDDLVGAFAKVGVKTATFVSEDGEMVSVTLPTMSEKTTVDSDKLQSGMSEDEWEIITKRVVDPEKLSAWLDTPETEQEKLRRLWVVSQATTHKPGAKPSPRYRVIGYVTPEELESRPDDVWPVVAKEEVEGVQIEPIDI